MLWLDDSSFIQFAWFRYSQNKSAESKGLANTYFNVPLSGFVFLVLLSLVNGSLGIQVCRLDRDMV